MTLTLEESLGLLFIGLIILNFIILFKCSMNNIERIFNPKKFYEDCELNWFGCALVLIFSHLCFFIVAFCYWFYKLCTVGRK